MNCHLYRGDIYFVRPGEDPDLIIHVVVEPKQRRSFSEAGNSWVGI